MATINGTAVNFAFSTAAGVTTSDISGIILQEAGYGKQSERSLVKDAKGNRVTSLHADQIETMTLRYVVSGTDIAASKTNTTLKTPGLFVSITGCDEIPDLVATNWEVISGDIRGTNDGPKEVTLTLEQAAGITAAAS